MIIHFSKWQKYDTLYPAIHMTRFWAEEIIFNVLTAFLGASLKGVPSLLKSDVVSGFGSKSKTFPKGQYVMIKKI